MLKHLPEQSFHHVGIASFVVMGKTVATGWGRASNPKELGTVMAQGITQVVQSNAVGQLAIKKADNVAPRRKCPALLVHLILRCQAAHHPNRGKLAKLIEYYRTIFGWFWLFHILDFPGRKSPKANHFLTKTLKPNGMAVMPFVKICRTGQLKLRRILSLCRFS